MGEKKRYWGFATVLLTALFMVSLTLYGCGSSGSSSSFSELLILSDGSTLKTASVSGATTTERSTATAPGIPGTYDRSGTTVTVTMPYHDLPGTGTWVNLTFEAGTGGTATSGVYQATIVDVDTFTITDTASGTITGGNVFRSGETSLDATYSQAGTTITVTFANHNLSNGWDVHLEFSSGTATDITGGITVVDADTFTLTADTAATTSGDVTATFGDNYTIFFASMHPSGNWVYATSMYTCFNGSPYCWGGGTVSRFAVNWANGALTFEKAERVIYGAQTNAGEAPTGLAFSPDGTQLYLHDDRLDGVEMFSVDTSTGDITYQAETGSNDAYLHGLAVSADGSRVYNGSNVYTIDTVTPAITQTNIGVGCNSSTMVGSNLYCADDDTGWGINIYSLADPDIPALTDFLSTTDQQSREVAVTSAGSLIVSSGWCGLKSFDFDGTTISAAAAAGSNEYIGCGGSWLTTGTREMYRTISLNAAGNLLATAYFTQIPGTQGGSEPSGYKLVNLAADGSLSLAQDYPNSYYSRVAKFIQKP